MLERYSKLPANIDDYGKTVYTTWVMSYERLSDRAKGLLWLLAYLHHDMIREETFERATTHLDREPIIETSPNSQETWRYVKDYLAHFLDSNRLWDSSKFSTVVDELQSCSLIAFDRVNDAYTLHVLVQDWARSVMPRTPCDALACSSHLLALSIDFSNDIKALTYRRGLLLQVGRVAQISERIGLDDAEYFAEVYNQNGRWKAEEGLLKQVLEARKRELGETHPDTLRSMNNLGWTYSKQGRWNEAEVLQVQVLEVSRRELGETHLDTLRSMNNLGWTYLNQGRWNEAEALQVQVLEVRRRELGETHPDTLASMNNLALTYSKQGRWNEAEALQVQVLEVRRREQGETHPDTLGSMNNLASTYSKQGRWNEAEALQMQVLEVRRRELGEFHPQTLLSMYNLACIYRERKKLDEAESLSLKTVGANKLVFGEHHRETLDALVLLSEVYKQQGRRRKRELKALEQDIILVKAALK
ncbi:kinesin light chain [Ceratobasidium sp. AG-Ba]|nr:kinesin light chain [Ceratobasidium sp. AG-Ba]